MLVNQIHRVAIHDLRRIDGGGFRVELGAGELPVSETVQRVITALYDMYGRRGSKSHGKFSERAELQATSGNVRNYLDGEAGGFPALTERMMSTLQFNASQRGAAEGGHVFFADFTRDASQYLLVAIVNSKLGAALTSNFNVTDVQHLDVDGFRFAGRVNLTGWQGGQDRYISFLKGKGDVAEYFKQFLGCDTSSPEREDTARLVEAMKVFADQQAMPEVDKQDFLSRGYAYCERLAKDQTQIDFDGFANAMFPEAPEAFRQMLFNPDSGLNDSFIPNRKVLRGLVKFEGKTGNWSVEFDRSAIATRQVVYDRERNSLTFNAVPDDLRQKLIREDPQRA